MSTSEFDELWPESLLKHVVKAPSQYDESSRAMAAEILRLRKFPDPRCPKCGFTMCELFDERKDGDHRILAQPNGHYRCYHCTPITAQEARRG